MAGFPKFDPHAFVRVFAANAANPANERRALATLAALADRHSEVAFGAQHFQLAAPWTSCEEELVLVVFVTRRQYRVVTDVACTGGSVLELPKAITTGIIRMDIGRPKPSRSESGYAKW